MEEQERILLSEYIEMLRNILHRNGDLPVVWIYDGHYVFRQIPYVSEYNQEDVILFMS